MESQSNSSLFENTFENKEISSSFMTALFGQNYSGTIPVWLMRQAGRYQPSYQALRAKYTFSEICLTPELAARVTLLPIQEMPLDAAILFSDILFPLEAIGLRVSFSSLSIPSVMSSVKYENSPEGRAKTVLYGEKTPLLECCKNIYKAIPIALERLGNVPLIGFSGAPWTLLTYVLGGETSERAEALIRYMKHSRKDFETLFEIVEKLVIDHVTQQIVSGCHAIQLFDSWGASVPDEEFYRYIAPSLKRISTSLPSRKDGTKCPLVYYTKSIEKRLNMLEETGIQAVSCDTESSIIRVGEWAKRTGMSAQGNFNPQLLVLSRNDIRVKEALETLLIAMERYPNFIFNLGHGVPKEANYDTVRYVVDFVKKWIRVDEKKRMR